MTGVQTCALPICFPVTIQGGLAGGIGSFVSGILDYTGYQAQVAQMKAAGLNPALMYGSAGGGGSTQGGAGMAGSASAGNGSVGGTPSAPDTGITSGVGMGMQLGLMEAQKRNLEAGKIQYRVIKGNVGLHQL